MKYVIEEDQTPTKTISFSKCKPEPNDKVMIEIFDDDENRQDWAGIIISVTELLEVAAHFRS